MNFIIQNNLLSEKTTKKNSIIQIEFTLNSAPAFSLKKYLFKLFTVFTQIIKNISASFVKFLYGKSKCYNIYVNEIKKYNFDYL